MTRKRVAAGAAGLAAAGGLALGLALTVFQSSSSTYPLAGNIYVAPPPAQGGLGVDADTVNCKRFTPPRQLPPGGIRKGCATFTKAYSLASPGDRICVRAAPAGGSYVAQTIAAPAAGGTVTFKKCNLTLVRVVSVDSSAVSAVALSGLTLGTSGSAPANTSLPTISGSTSQGSVLTAATGAWTNSPSSYTYQWQRCNSSGASCSNLGGATASTYTLVAGDVASTIRVAVTATNAAGSASATSIQSALIVASGNFNIYVNTSAGGSPSRCGSPCAYVAANAYGSLVTACAAASAGDTIGVKGGNYGTTAQVIRRADCTFATDVTFRIVPGETISQMGWIKLGNRQSGADAPDHIELDGTGGTWNVQSVGVDYSGIQSDGIGIHGLKIHSLDNPFSDTAAFMRIRDAKNISITGNEIWGCCGGDAIGLEVTNTSDPSPENVVATDNYIHDVYDTCSEVPGYLGACTGVGYGDCTSCNYDHVDAFHIWGGLGLTVARNTIYLQGDHKQGIFMESANGGTYSNILVENNAIANTSDNELSFGNGTSVLTGYLHVYNNTIQGSAYVYNGWVTAGTPVIFANNIITDFAGNQTGGGCGGITYGGGSTLNVTWTKNLQGSTGPCSGDLTPASTPSFVQANWPGGGLSSSTGVPDLHLAIGTQAADNSGNPTYCPSTDIDGQTRNCSSPDVGADER